MPRPLDTSGGAITQMSLVLIHLETNGGRSNAGISSALRRWRSARAALLQDVPALI
jgi:hypothetical protein